MRRLVAILSFACVIGVWTGAPASAGQAGNKPGKPHSEEMRQRILQRFDKDGDGKLNEEERKAARETMQALHQGKGKGPGGVRPKGLGQKGAGGQK